MAKIEAARRAGVQKVIIPEENWLSVFDAFPDIEIIPVHDLEEVFMRAFAERAVFTAGTVLETAKEQGLSVST